MERSSNQHVAIVGSKTYPRPDLIATYVDRLAADCVLVSGGAPGVDNFAEEAAEARGLRTLIFHADWKRLGRRAGPIRYEQIVAHADRVVAFWDGQSCGTLNALVLASRAGLSIEIYGAHGEPVELQHAFQVAETSGVFASIAAAEQRAAKAKQAGER